ncbi:hypothetical protein QBC45DRAFT_424728 [Copromyces sp. CBS 386.78]|nr:hypothetical protein QBC45DRAFT_424728 [Copromyces sp. CBS 386.78]
MRFRCAQLFGFFIVFVPFSSSKNREWRLGWIFGNLPRPKKAQQKGPKHKEEEKSKETWPVPRSRVSHHTSLSRKATPDAQTPSALQSLLLLREREHTFHLGLSLSARRVGTLGEVTQTFLTCNAASRRVEFTLKIEQAWLSFFLRKNQLAYTCPQSCVHHANTRIQPELRVGWSVSYRLTERHAHACLRPAGQNGQ